MSWKHDFQCIEIIFRTMKLSLKKVAAFVLTLAIIAMPVAVFAQTPDFGTSYLSNSDLPDTDAREVVINLINTLLGVLGIVFLLLVLYGGFLWMTAGGNDDRASQGRKIIGNGIVGLIIIFLAFAITTFVFTVLSDATP